MFKPISALAFVGLAQFNWLIHDQHFSLKKEKKYSIHQSAKKLKDYKDAGKSSTKLVQKQAISRFINFKNPNFLKISKILKGQLSIRIPTSTGFINEFTPQTTFNQSSLSSAWFGCCRRQPILT